jgi:ABC-type Zn uptake system ZnuABC Zn-binding protein ZnuA
MGRNFMRLAAGVLVLLAAGCGPEKSPPKPRVVVTTSILGDWAGRIGREEIDLVVLVPPGSDAHTFQPTTADAAAIESAALLISVGEGYESWLPGLIEATRTKAVQLELTRGMSLIEREEEDHDHQEHEGHEHAQGAEDPHFWHDPELAMQAVSEITDALKPLLPGREKNLDQRSDAYQEAIREAGEKIRARVAALPPERRKLVTSHDSFAYFAQRFGFEILGNALGSLSTEASRPSASELAALVAVIKDSGVPALFPETTLDSGLVRQVAKEAGVAVAPPLMAETLNPPGEPGSTYLEMLAHNAETICAALGLKK